MNKNLSEEIFSFSIQMQLLKELFITSHPGSYLAGKHISEIHFSSIINNAQQSFFWKNNRQSWLCHPTSKVTTQVHCIIIQQDPICANFTSIWYYNTAFFLKKWLSGYNNKPESGNFSHMLMKRWKFGSWLPLNFI